MTYGSTSLARLVTYSGRTTLMVGLNCTSSKLASCLANGHPVDICITTDWKEMEGVCIIADLLKRRMMRQTPNPLSLSQSLDTDRPGRRHGKGCLRFDRKGAYCEDMGS